MRMLRLARAKPEAIDAARVLVCPSCPEFSKPRRPAAAKVPVSSGFGEIIVMDIGYFANVKKSLFSALLIVDDATEFVVAAPIRGGGAHPNGK